MIKREKKKMITPYHKNCPTCNKVIYYSKLWNLNNSIKNNKNCKKCAKKGTVPTFIKDGKIDSTVLEKIKKGWFKKGSIPKNAIFRKGKTIDEIYGIKKALELKNKMSSRIQSIESNKKRSKSCIKSKCGYSNKGRKTSEKLKCLFRKQMISRLMNTYKNFHPPYNIKACEHFNNIMRTDNINIQHALNGGEYHIKELGYWVDGYDKINNTVYEWDEKRHFNKDGTLKTKDILRENEIKKFLNCKFIRIKDPNILF